uniref:Tetratricopeptide repeat-containing protein n=1 Tax=Candidatus Kentrum sp. TC TaxID=2126339 RepID=A0A450YLM9_9GAMM|nr:MAG: Tetratricopeptide repeat-containing protein [Candidatus Kentron sp. TC]
MILHDCPMWKSPRHMIRSLGVSVIFVVFAFLAPGFPEAGAAPSQCETLEFLCVVEPIEQRRENRAIPTLEEIKTLANRRDFDAALKGMERFLEKTPNDIEGRLLLGVFLIWRGDLDQATDVFRKLADDRPDLAEPHNNLAAIYAVNEKYQEAEDALEKAISVNPSYGIAWENLGDIRIRYAALLYKRAGELYAFDERNGIEAKTGIEMKFLTIRKILDEIDYSFRTRETMEVTLRDRTDIDVTTATKDSLNTRADPTVESSAACYSVGPLLDKANFMSISEWFDRNDIFTSTHTRAMKPHGHEVFVPLSGKRKDLDALIERMRRDGVRDITPIPRNDLQHDVIIGVFDTENAAKHRIGELWEKGYEARHRPRSRPANQYWIKAYPTTDSSLDGPAFARRFPAHVLRTIPCE